ncbi:MAG: hypothetical protein UT01_C0029G0003 [Candidatus Daviesbacteria bacterium GW2011_GWA1_38_7]|nr:MAG: hypothetical protein UT01_C0029G0003 [Candidatus Daviesbacteria bacterium GW2011_GWA1_38_7]
MNFFLYQKSINKFIKEYTLKQVITVFSLALILSSISYQFFDLSSALGFISGALTLLIISILNTLFAKYFSNYFFGILNNPKDDLNQLSLTASVEIILSSLISTIALLTFYNFTESTHGLILFLLGATLVSAFFHLGGLIYSGSLNLGFNLLIPSDVKIHKEDIKLLKTNSSVISKSLKVSSYLTDFTLSNLFILISLILLGLIKLPLVNNSYTLILVVISFYIFSAFTFQYTVKHELYKLISLSLNDFIVDTKQLKTFKRFLTNTKINKV